MTRNNMGTSSNFKTKKRGLLLQTAVSCVPSKRRRRCDESAVSSEDEVSLVTIPRSLYFLFLLVGTRAASRVSSSSAHHTSLSLHDVPSTFTFSATKTKVTDNLKDLIQRFNLQLKRGIHDASNAGSGSISTTAIVQVRPMNGIETDISDGQLCREAFYDILSWINMMDETVQEQDIVQSQNLTCLLLEYYLHHPNDKVTCFVMDMLRYLAGSSNHLRQKMGSQLELVFSILRILKENVFNLCKQQLGISIMSWLVEVENCRAMMIKEGCIEHLFHAMDIYQWDDVVQCNATATLCWLMHCSPTSSFLTTSSTSVSEEQPSYGSTLEHPRHCVVVLMNTMRRFLLDAKVFGNALSVLSGLLLKHPLESVNSSPPDDDSPTLDIVRLTLVGMRFHQVGCPKVQSNGLALLRIMLAHDGGEAEAVEVVLEGRDSVIATVVSNLDVIEECMKQYSEESFIQAEACGILAYLVSSSSSSTMSTLSNNTGVRASILQSGCIEAVVQAQMKHRGDVRLQHYALWFHSGLLRDASSPGADAFGAGLPVLDTLAAGRIVPMAATEE